MTRPTDDYLWAESAPSQNIANPTAKRPGGYDFEDPLPHNEYNYIERSNGRWIDYLRRQSDAYTDLPNAISNSSPGELVRVFRDVANDYRGLLRGTLGGNNIIAQDTDGRFLYVARRQAGAFALQQVNISNWTVVQTYTLDGVPTDANPIRAVSADGQHVAVCWGGNLEVFNSTSGVRVINIELDVLGDAWDVHCHGTSVALLVRGTTLTSASINLYSLSTFAFLGTVTIGMPDDGEGAITCNGRQILVAHTTSTATQTMLTAYDIVPNGGALDVLSSVTWLGDLVQHRAIETNGEYIAVGVAGTSNQVRVYSLTQLADRDVTIQDVTQVGSDECHSIVFSPGLMIVASTSASNVDMTAYELGSFSVAWRDSQVSEVSIGLGRIELSTDGLHVYVPSGTLAQRIGQVSIGRHVTSWLRCDPATPYRRPFYNLIIPSEG